MNYQNGNKELNKNSFNSKNNHQNIYEDSNINSIGNNEMLDNLIKISGNQEVYKELKNETSKIKKLLSESKEKLSNINLYERQKSDIDIYQWNNLFNQSIPITSYVSSSKSIKKLDNKKEEDKNENEKNKDNLKNSKHPVALVDLNDEEIKKYLPPPPIGVPPSNVIRFQKLPFRGDSNDAFYFSNDFNDYYKMDFKQFIERMPVLKAKKRSKSAKLAQQVRFVRKKSVEENQKREFLRNQMSNILNNLYIEKQYLSLSKNANNIEPLMNSIRSQVYQDEEEEITKSPKIYNKSDKPSGSEIDVENINFSANQRSYDRNEIRKLTFKRRKEKSVKRLFLPKYDINDPDIAIFKRVELLDKQIKDENGNKLAEYGKEEKKFLSNFEGERKKEEENVNNKKMIKSEISSNYENQNNNNYKLVKNEIKKDKVRSMSAKRIIKKNAETSNIQNNKKYPRAMSANTLRPNPKENEYSIHKIYLSSRNKLGHHHNGFLKGRYINNKLNDLYDDNKRNSISQISTYEGMNNSIYERQNVARHGFPFKNNHQIQNKMYQKINRRLKEKQYEKDQKKLEEFSKLIRLDDAFLPDNFIKEKLKNNKNNNNTNNGLFYIDKNKIFNRPLSSYHKKIDQQNLQKFQIKNNFTKPQTPKLKYNKSNNFRTISKKSSNENSKIDFTTSVLNSKHEYYLNNNNDKITLVYFNDVIETKHQNPNEMKPIIKNDGIIVAPNYFNRGKPQLINYSSKNEKKKYLKRAQSGRVLGNIPNNRDNVIIQEEHLEMYRRKKNYE